MERIRDKEVKDKIISMQTIVANAYKEEKYNEVASQILNLINDLDKVSPEEDRIGCGEDFCGTWDDVAGTWGAFPGIKQFILEHPDAFKEQQKEKLIPFLLRRYASHEPGGRTSCMQMLLALMEKLPEEIMSFLTERACNSTIDRTHLSRIKPINLLESIIPKVKDIPKLYKIISLRISELYFDEDDAVRNKAKSIFENYTFLKENAVIQTESINKEEINKILDKLSDPDFIIRWKSVLQLRNVNYPLVALDPLLDALDDKNSFVRSAAAFVMGKLKLKLATDYLIEHVARDINDYVRVRCAYALGDLADQAALWRLINLYDNEVVYTVRFAIKVAIAEINPSKAMQLSLKDLNDENPGRRLFAVEDIRKIKWKNEEVLKSALDIMLAHLFKEELISVKRTLKETIKKLYNEEITVSIKNLELKISNS